MLWSAKWEPVASPSDMGCVSKWTSWNVHDQKSKVFSYSAGNTRSATISHDGHSTCEWNIFPAISINKGCCSHQAITLQPCGWLTLSELRLETIGLLTSKPSVTAITPKWWTLRGFRMEKARVLAPDSRGAYEINDFSEPRLFYPPMPRQVPTYLTWDICFFFFFFNEKYSFDVPMWGCRIV